MRFLLPAALAVAVVSCNKDSGPGPDPDQGFVARTGLFAVMEGNEFGGECGALLFLGDNVASLPASLTDAYAAANNGHIVGTALEDMFIADGKIYLLSQSTYNGGDGQLVVVDATTLETVRTYPSLGLSVGDWPQHIVVAGGKAFVQCSYNSESQSGIRILDLESGSLAANDIAGTFGDFTVDGATKCRMLLSRGKIYAPCGQSLAIIDPASGTVVRKVDFTGRQVKDIVKTSTGGLFLVLSGTYDMISGEWGPEASLTSPASIVRIDADGTVKDEQTLPLSCAVSAQSWCSNVGLCASLTSERLFFFAEWWDTKIYCYDIASRQLTTIDLTANGIDKTTYGYLCVDPASNTLVAPVADYTTSAFALFNATTLALKSYDPSIVLPVNYCAGVDCSYRYLPSFLAR
ncbi:hypothetical protein FACS1894159_01530 [Bacteroidia bacterium]|nr:hypothetical protein FACS1894159_01530 [Bacteroidia bacterium]